jgi:hypothetical protein
VVINTAYDSLHCGVLNVPEPQWTAEPFVLTKQYFHCANVGVWVLVSAVMFLWVGDT